MLKNSIKPSKLLLALLVILSLLLSPVSNGDTVEAQGANGHPAHYIVFKGKADGHYEVVHYSEVQLSSELRSLDDATLQSWQASSPRHKDLIIVLFKLKMAGPSIRDWLIPRLGCGVNGLSMKTSRLSMVGWSRWMMWFLLFGYLKLLAQSLFSKRISRLRYKLLILPEL